MMGVEHPARLDERTTLYRALRVRPTPAEPLRHLLPAAPGARRTLANHVRLGSRVPTQFTSITRDWAFAVFHAVRASLEADDDGPRAIAVIAELLLPHERTFDMSTRATAEASLERAGCGPNNPAVCFGMGAREVVVRGAIPAAAVHGIVELRDLTTPARLRSVVRAVEGALAAPKLKFKAFLRLCAAAGIRLRELQRRAHRLVLVRAARQRIAALVVAAAARQRRAERAVRKALRHRLAAARDAIRRRALRHRVGALVVAAANRRRRHALRVIRGALGRHAVVVQARARAPRLEGVLRVGRRGLPHRPWCRTVTRARREGWALVPAVAEPAAVVCGHCSG